ncbi:MAG: 30S ribosomal protein S4 [Bryobacterales bacterium]
MARNRGPVVRKSRRLGLALDPKSERLLDKRPYPPGQHGKSRRPKKMSNYGTQLQEKQKARFMYDVLERQFRRYYEKATHMKGVVGDNMMSLLEQRLDNVIFRLGFAMTRRMARQIVNHGHIAVNGRKVDIPSYQVQPGDIVEIREKSREHGGIQTAIETPAHSLLPSWLEVEPQNFRGRVIGTPSKHDVEQTQINAQLIVELYSR